VVEYFFIRDHSSDYVRTFVDSEQVVFYSLVLPLCFSVTLLTRDWHFFLLLKVSHKLSGGLEAGVGFRIVSDNELLGFRFVFKAF
jgi:hypothetical protein